ncbi:MAG: hypothetical protein IPH76_12815 [Xanthomonadales bacterium]|nr:hypothetical protein [Xanthomonadales bacterium]
MSIYLEDYPGALQPRRTPFDDAGEPSVPEVFIYMTNRYEGRWSYLMPLGFEREHDPINHIGMGYTQLWILQKLRAVHPRPGAQKKLRKAHVLQLPSFEDGVQRDDFIALFHVLREPGGHPSEHNDHIGGRRKLADAIEFAQVHADHAQRRVVVAKLVHDWTWH